MSEILATALLVNQLFTPEIKNACFEPIAKSIGIALNYLWESTVGEKVNYMHDRMEFMNKSNSFKGQISSEINKIDENHLQEPKMCIAGPLFDAAKFFIEEDVYVEIFSKLIAASCNSQYNEILHPAYAEVIKQLSPLDDLLMKFLHYKDNVNGYAVLKDNIDFTIIECDLVYEYGVERVAQSVSNLSRLGIFIIHGYRETANTVSFKSGDDSTNVEFPPLNTPFTDKLEAEGYKISPSRYYITNFGHGFIDICIG